MSPTAFINKNNLSIIAFIYVYILLEPFVNTRRTIYIYEELKVVLWIKIGFSFSSCRHCYVNHFIRIFYRKLLNNENGC